MTLEDRLERLANRTPPGDPADVLAAARARAEAGIRPGTRPPRILAAAAALAVVALAAGAMAVLGDDDGTTDVATGPDTPGTVAPDDSGQQHAAGPTVRVEAAGLPNVDITTSPLRQSGAAESGGWLDHTVTMENTGPDPLHLNDFRTGTVLGDREVLAATDGCGYGSVLSEPAVPACRQNYQPVTIDPGATYQFDVTLWRDLDGMNPVTVGSYRWRIEIRVGPEPFADPRTPSGEVATLTVHYDGLAKAADAGSRTDGPDPQGGLDGPVIFAPRRDNAGSDYALLAGTLARSGDCLYLANGLAGRYVIVWPHGTVWDAGRTGVVLPDGGFLPVGEQFTASGGYHGFSEFPNLPKAAAARAESCADPNTDSAAVIQSPGVSIGGLDGDAARIGEDFLELAANPSAETADRLPFADEVQLGLGRDLRQARSPAELADPSSWVIDTEVFRAYSGPFSALDVAAGADDAVVAIGEHPHCASPPVPAPDAVADLTRVSVQPNPDAIESCLQWWTVDLFVNDDGRIEAVTLDLWEP